MKKVYIVRNECSILGSISNDIILVTESFENAETCLETCKNDTTLQIDNGEYEIFSKDYNVEYDGDVESIYSKSENQICFSNEKGDYDIYWIEEHELV